LDSNSEFRGRRDALWALFTAVPGVFLIAPVLWPDWFLAHGASAAGYSLPGLAAACLLPCATGLVIYRWCLPFPADERRQVWLCILLLSVWCLDLHYSNVDLASYFGKLFTDNVAWQRWLHERVLRLQATSPLTDEHGRELIWPILPHSYRFLPDCLVAWLALLTKNYLAATLVYRLTFQLLIYCCLYRLARLYAGHVTGLMALLAFTLTYPPGIRYYAGQLADPMSHLSFGLSLLLLLDRRRWLFGATVFWGVLAKESILVMPAFACLTAVTRREGCLSYAIGGVCALALAISVRLGVAGDPSYEKVSGVTLAHVSANLADVWYWGRQAWETVGILTALTALHYRRQPRLLLGCALFLFVTLWTSSALFSHLKEARNFVPACIPLSITAGIALTTLAGRTHDRQNQEPP
jgi:hypothetical protein